MSYNELKKEIENAPMTWLPALFQAVIKACQLKKVFAGPRGMSTFCRKVETGQYEERDRKRFHEAAESLVPPSAWDHTIKQTGVELIAKERQRQIEKEGWSADHDDTHAGGELAHAGAAYARAAAMQANGHAPRIPHDLWPWGSEWWKASEDPVRNLVKAGALIAAEIDRLRRNQAQT